ncbi:MAG: OmpH family outer membrane protein [Planctomycetota bacterium]|nr:OmpH family outer membrane protein [Planctomycetota bacterium]
MIGRRGGVAAGVLACTVLCLGQQAAQAEDGGKRIAVVNVARVFGAYQKVADVQDKMKKLYDKEHEAIQAEGVELKKRQDDIQVDPRNPKTNLEFFQKIQQFELDKMKLELRFQKLAQEVEEKRKNEMRAVLNDIKNAIRAVGTAEKFDLVLRAPEFDDEFDPSKASAKDKEEKEKNEAQSAADLVRKFRENPVLFFSTGVDVTQKVIEKLNADYKATQK